MPDEDDFILSQSKIAIVGLGLMGGSLALALRGRCAAIYGVDPDQATLEMARRQNIVDLADTSLKTILAGADIVILAAPVPEIITLIEQLPNEMPNPCIVLDLGSTKQLIVEAMSRLPKRFIPIGGHPLCGKEKLSLANSERTLYYAAPFLLTPLERTSARALSAVHQIIEAIGANPIILDAAEHDRALASTSHLPFLLSSALALATSVDATPFIGPGFKSTSRLAGTSSSMMLGVLQSNRRNVVDVVHRFRESLDEIESSLEAGNDIQLQDLLKRASSRYNELITAQ
jgi:prephenate dehydrogenase